MGLIFFFKLGYYWLQNAGIFNLIWYLFIYLYTKFNRFGNFQIRITKSILCAERFFKIMDYKPRIDCKAFEEEKDTGIIRELEGNIELKNVNFNYPSKIDVPKEYYSKEYFFSNIEKELNFNNEDLCSFFYSVFLSNINNLIMLKSKKLSDFNNDELKMYKTNIQINFTSSSLCDNENNFKVLMQLNKKNEKCSNNELFEIDEKDLDNVILKLKDIYGQIKS